MGQGADRRIIDRLQQQIIGLQGKSHFSEYQLPLGLGPMELAFPGKVFAQAAVHELISASSEEAACTSGFMAVVLSRLMQQDGSCMWISTQPRRSVFPPALKVFGIAPERILFLDTARPKETLWALEEALKCNALTAVVGELNELSFSDSRRLQLAVEQSRVTAFIHRFRPKSENAVACVTRWKIRPIPSDTIATMPGLGFPRWNIELLKVRNGRPGSWQVQWSPQGLDYLEPATLAASKTQGRQTG